MFLQGEAVPAQEASLQRSDVAEERVGSLNGLDYRNSMCPEFSVNDHTSHERHHTQAGGMRMVYPALWLREVRRMRLMVSWDTP